MRQIVLRFIEQEGKRMAEIGKKLGKLSIAILEHFVESKLGEKFVKKLREGTDRQIAIEGAMLATADRLWKQWEDKRLWNAAFNHLPKKKQLLDDLKQAIQTFYGHPTDTGFADVLTEILHEHKEFSDEMIKRGVGEYIEFLTKEMTQADETFRENRRALADLNIEKSQQETVDTLHRIEGVLTKQTSQATTVPSDLRNLHQLPPAPADFINRPEELTELRAAFGDGKRAAISGLTGMGGIGKTVLGLVVAHELAKDYPDAQIFLDLKGTTAPLTPADAMRHVIHSCRAGRRSARFR
jgi:hypothetical protein